MDRNSNVAHFMILGSARTGSNLLVSLLSAHSHIKTYGELFNLDMLPKESLREALEDPIVFLNRRVYKPHRPEISAVGFKMFYDHLTKHYFQKPISVSEASPQLQELFAQFAGFIEINYSWDILDKRFRATWEYLQADKSLAVIHLKRRNMLHTLISLKKAFMTQLWWSVRDRPQTTRAIHLDPDECNRYFHRLDRFAAEADMVFADHQKIEVCYEDIVDQREETLQRIF